MSPRTTKTHVDLVAASILLAAMTAVTACSAPPSPNVTAPPVVHSPVTAPAETPPAPPTPASTPSPYATWPFQMALPTPPPEMSRDDEAGAVAAATYFFTQLYPYTVSSHDTSRWLEMSHELCSYCSSIVDSAAGEERSGTTTIPGTVTVERTSAEKANALTYGVKLEITVDHDVQRSRAGTVIREFPAQRLQLGAVVVWHVDRWLVRGVDVLSSEDLD